MQESKGNRFIYSAIFTLAIAITGLALTAGKATAGNWYACTNEGGWCKAAKGEYVKWATKRHGGKETMVAAGSSGGVWCDTRGGFPKGDPAVGRSKSCFIYKKDWEPCTNEGGWCKASKGQYVKWATKRHGGKETMVAAGSSGGVWCDTRGGFPKGDPAVGRSKSCYIFR